jgi:hypothetical protein
MAAVTRVKARVVTPVGYEVVSPAQTVTENVTAGDLLILGASGWSRSPNTTPAAKHGFAAQDYVAGQSDCSVLFAGEMDGWSGLTPGAPLYPGATGGLDDAAVTGFVGLIHALTATRISFTL